MSTLDSSAVAHGRGGHPDPVRPPHPARGRGRTAALALAAVTVTCAVGYVTLGPPGVVAGSRSAVVDAMQALLGPWVGAAHRAPVENVANALLFLPVGAVAGLVLAHRGRSLPLLAGVALSVTVELGQSLLAGRVPDPVDVAANSAGAALGVCLVVLARARRRPRPPRAGRPVRLTAALLAVPVLAALAACQPGAATGVPDHARESAVALDGPAGTRDAADGWVADGESLSPFADVPAVAELDPALRQAVQDAARAAERDGVELRVTSGWRSAGLQQALFDAAVAEHGSEEAASRYVLRPEDSAHVAGRAVDIGPTDAMSWMTQHGSDHGLCMTYGNELWHYELTVAPGETCPAPAPDASAG